jgi:hypothetical protein
MKLPDFKVLSDFNNPKEKMGIPRNVYGNLHVEILPDRLTLTDLNVLESPTGLDVSIDEIGVEKNGTLSFKGQQVVVYIRDKAQYSVNYSDPRFHLANCTTLVQMRRNNQFGKYVATSNKSGRFEMNLMRNNKAYPVTKQLCVCQNCLEFLHYGSFSLSQCQNVREKAVMFSRRYSKIRCQDGSN